MLIRSEYGAHESAFGSDTNMAVMRYTQIFQVILPLLIIEEVLFRGFPDLSEHGFGKLVRFHVGKGILVDPVIVLACTQDLEEVDSAFGVGTFKPGEKVIAHVCTVTIFPVMASTGIVHVDKGGDLESHGEDFILFLMETILVLNQDRTELAGRDIDAPFLQLFEQKGLCDVTLIALVQNETVPRWGKMTLDFRRQLAHNVTSVRSLPTFDDIADKLRVEEIRSRTTTAIARRPEPPPKLRDPRLPPPGSLIERRYAGRAYRIKVLEDSLRYRHITYSSPAKLVQAITGTSKSGFDFLGLTVPWPKCAAQLRYRRMNRATMIDLPIATEF